MKRIAAIVAKYRTIFVIGVAERLTYRSDFFVGTLMRFMPIVTTVFLWKAVFAGSSNTRIANLTNDEMVAYFLLVLIGRAFSSMPGLAHGIANDIRSGDLKKYLTQPVHMIAFLLTMRVAHKIVYYSIAALPFAIVFYLCRGYFAGWPSWTTLAAFVYSLALAFLIGFFFEALVGMLAFWFLEISSFAFIIITFVYLMSGHMFPLDLIPGWFGQVVLVLPFQYLAYFPAVLFLHGDTWTTSELFWRLAEATATTALLAVCVKVAFARGLRHYSAYGG